MGEFIAFVDLFFYKLFVVLGSFCKLGLCFLACQPINRQTEFVLEITQRPVSSPSKYPVDFTVIKPEVLKP
ncbi:Uncharacterised protein [Mycobacteroides abscessus subsp. abscessus]|nr:Uncharacterised protein [Mycobacteroides abscessus subsp. abscessus]